MKIRLGWWLQFSKSPSGEISENGCWVCFHNGMYLYVGETIFSLFRQMVCEWKDDKHIVG